MLWNSTILFLAISIFGIVLNIKQKAKLNEIIEKANFVAETNIALKEVQSNMISNIAICSKKLKDIPLFKINLDVQDKDFNRLLESPIKLSNIVKSDKIVFIFYSYSCQKCVHEQLSKLVSLGKHIGYPNILLLCDKFNENILWEIQASKVPFEVYQFQKDILRVEDNNSSQPIIFLCDEKLNVNIPFKVYSNTMDYEDCYYKVYQERFQSDSQKYD
jgi:hypothetical protein